MKTNKIMVKRLFCAQSTHILKEDISGYFMSPLTQNRFSLWGSPLTEGILFAFRTSHCIFLTVILSIVDVINSLYLQIVVLDFCFSAIDNIGVYKSWIYIHPRTKVFPPLCFYAIILCIKFITK